MTTLTVRTASDQRGWDDFVLRSGDPDCFLQSWQWGEFQSAVGRKILRLEVVEGDALRAVCLLIPHTTKIGKPFLLAPRGPIIDRTLSPDDQSIVWTRLVEEVGKQRPSGTMFLKIEPNVAPTDNIEYTPGTGTHPQHTLVVDVNQTDDQLLAAMHQKTRYNITLARRKGVSVRWTRDPGDIDIFLVMLAQTAKHQGIGVHPDNYYRTMIKSLGDAVEVAVADHHGLPLAAAIMIRFGTTTTYLHGASDHSQRDMMAPFLLHWETLQRARTFGSRTYDFYGIAPEGAVDHKWAGITRFKKGFGGRVVSYAGAYNIVYDRT